MDKDSGIIIENPIINKSIEYILNHINEDISVDDVASYCNFSKFHFSRMFKSETGMSIYYFIKQLKIDQSAVNIKIEPHKSITEIGEKYGYSLSNYSSVFTKQYSISPKEFRKSTESNIMENPFYINESAHFKSFDFYNEKISIEEMKQLKVIKEKHIGNYVKIGESWDKFMEKYKDYINKDNLLIEKSYNDPSISKVNECVYDLCITVDEDVEHENLSTIEGNKYAVYRFDNFISEIIYEFSGLFSIWLPNSSYERSDEYVLGIYRKIDRANSRVAMDLYIPIK